MRIQFNTRLILTASLAVVLVFVLAACSPKHDWRVIGNYEHGWQATFPAKPVQFSRELILPGTTRPVALTLSSAKVDEAMFAVGWIVNGNESTRRALEAAMLANINYQQSSIRQAKVTVSGLEANAIQADGEMRIQAGKKLVPVRMHMRTLTINTPQPLVIEIIAVGPATDLSAEIAEQFVESLRITR
jgi:hypothetical protein